MTSTHYELQKWWESVTRRIRYEYRSLIAVNYPAASSAAPPQLQENIEATQ
jgi:hypothetical protein